ncbi:MAG TPA: hypothetical protein VF485_16295 [Sphingomonas sp.]
MISPSPVHAPTPGHHPASIELTDCRKHLDLPRATRYLDPYERDPVAFLEGATGPARKAA